MNLLQSASSRQARNNVAILSDAELLKNFGTTEWGEADAPPLEVAAAAPVRHSDGSDGGGVAPFDPASAVYGPYGRYSRSVHVADAALPGAGGGCFTGLVHPDTRLPHGYGTRTQRSTVPARHPLLAEALRAVGGSGGAEGAAAEGAVVASSLTAALWVNGQPNGRGIERVTIHHRAAAPLAPPLCTWLFEGEWRGGRRAGRGVLTCVTTGNVDEVEYDADGAGAADATQHGGIKRFVRRVAASLGTQKPPPPLALASPSPSPSLTPVMRTPSSASVPAGRRAEPTAERRPLHTDPAAACRASASTARPLNRRVDLALLARAALCEGARTARHAPHAATSPSFSAAAAVAAARRRRVAILRPSARRIPSDPPARAVQKSRSPQNMTTPPTAAPALRLGQRVVATVNREEVGGVVMFCGPARHVAGHGASGRAGPSNTVLVGIACDTARPGGHDGTVRGVTYFACARGHGLLVPREVVVAAGAHQPFA